MMPKARNHIFCLEGEWSPRLCKHIRVQPALELLRQYAGVKSIYRDIGTVDELEFYLRRWAQKQYTKYSVAYLSFHGVPGSIYVGRKAVALDQIGEWLSGKCRGRVLHFGSCSTFSVRRGELQQLVRTTRARLVCGYKTDVDWMDAAAFELLLLTELSRCRHTKAQLTRWLTKRADARVLARSLGFRAFSE